VLAAISAGGATSAQDGGLDRPNHHVSVGWLPEAPVNTPTISGTNTEAAPRAAKPRGARSANSENGLGSGFTSMIGVPRR
jgi:hypothetical protein